MLTFTYVIQTASGRLYVGMTTEPKSRIMQHRLGECPSSKTTDCITYDFVAVYPFDDEITAHRFECFLQELPVIYLLKYLADNPCKNPRACQDAHEYEFPHERYLPGASATAQGYSIANQPVLGSLGHLTT